MSKKRFTSEIQQEHISRAQLSGRFSEFGWVPTSPPDLGEDFIVSVYHEGVATGIGFYVQEKSVRDIEDRKSGEYLKYRIEVKDLKHWEGFSLPVVLIIWDIELHEGRWILVKDLISNLDMTKSQWRGFSTQTVVRIPWGNTTDDEGLNSLKKAIGQSVYPLISEGRDFELKAKFAFPDTDEGRAQQKGLEKHFREGEPIIVKASYIQDLEFSEWWDKWFGDYDPDQMELHLGGLASNKPTFFTITLNPTDGEIVTLQNLEFSLIQGGTDLLVFSNESTAHPIHFMLSLRKEEDRIHYNLSHSTRRTPTKPLELLALINFKQAVSRMGTLQILFRNGEEQSHSGNYKGDPDTAPDPRYVKLIEKLCLILSKTGLFLEIPEGGIQEEHISPILELSEIVERGFTIRPNMTATTEFKGEALRRMVELKNQSKPIRLRLVTPESFVELFGNEVQVGPMIRDIQGKIGMDEEDFEDLVSNTAPDEFIKVDLVDCYVVEYFQNWADEPLEEVLRDRAV